MISEGSSEYAVSRRAPSPHLQALEGHDPSQQGQYASPPSDALLDVRGLTVQFPTRIGTATVVSGVSYELRAGETLGIVGESGSGKSVGVSALIGLIPQPPARVRGEVWLNGRDILRTSDSDLNTIRGRQIAMIFQDPMGSLNPSMRIGKQVAEGMRLHLGVSAKVARARTLDLLDRVGIPHPRQRVDDYPHQFSGGMRQRVMIALALACEPEILIADEATTALDVTIQAQIIELVREIQRESNTAVIWISHDLGVVAGMADRVLVMYAGRVVEDAPVECLYDHPAHPYTKGLLASVPRIGPSARDDLPSIPGRPPDPARLPLGCSFGPRCGRFLGGLCDAGDPELQAGCPHHRVACFRSTPGEADVHRDHEKTSQGGSAIDTSRVTGPGGHNAPGNGISA